MATAQEIRTGEKLRFPDDPSAALKCPNCHHNFEVVASPRVRHVSRLQAKLFKFFHCRVCDFEFRRFNRPVWFAVATATMCLMAGAALGQCLLLWEQGFFVTAR